MGKTILGVALAGIIAFWGAPTAWAVPYDGIVDVGAGEECDDGDSDSGDGCDSDLHVEPGFTCDTGGDCAMTCGSLFDFHSNDGVWTAEGTGDAAFSHGASATFGATGWETGLSAELADTVAAVKPYIYRRVAFAPLADARATAVHLSYQMNSAGDCLNLYVVDSLPPTGDPLYTDCVNHATTFTAPPIPVAASDLGQTRFVVVEFAAAATPSGAREGLFVEAVEIYSDVDSLTDGGNSVRDYASLACGDPCVDADNDGYGDVTSAGDRSAACSGGSALDCDDDDGAAHPGQPEDCSTAADTNCSGGPSAEDAACFEDCGLFGDESPGNDLADCNDPQCDGTVGAVDAMCVKACQLVWEFSSGPAFVASGLWVFDDGEDRWGTSNIDASGPPQSGVLRLDVPFGARKSVGPAPELTVDFALVAGNDSAFGLCVQDAADPDAGCSSTTTTCAAAAAGEACLAWVRAGNLGASASASAELDRWIGTADLQLTFVYETGSSTHEPGATIFGLSIGSDIDGDGLYEGIDPFSGGTVGCDPCWDGDFDSYGDSDSPNVTMCASGSSQVDCNDNNSAERPGLVESIEAGNCADGLNNDCSEGADAFDSGCGVEDCANGIDDNGDTNIDCADPTCVAPDGSTRDPACDLCYTGYNFDARLDATVGMGWAPTGRLDGGTNNTVFALATHDGERGWRTHLNGGGKRVRGWLTRALDIPSTMATPAVEVTVDFDRGSRGVWGVCVGVGTPTACAMSQPANVLHFSRTATVAQLTDDTTSPAGVTTYNDGKHDHVIVPVPQHLIGQDDVNVVVFFDSEGTDGAAGDRLFIDAISLRSDLDLDGEFENAGVTCDHCVDRDEDGYGDPDVLQADIDDCTFKTPDCDDDDNETNPGIGANEATGGFCYRAGDTPIEKDNNCDGKTDNLDINCAVCPNGRVEFGESCDDGNVDNNDGCDSDCQVETGQLYISEIHVPILFASPGEQWVEIYNATDNAFNLLSLDFELALGDCELTANPADCALRLGFTGDDPACSFQTTTLIQPGTFYVINLGNPSDSGFNFPGSDIDATCTTPTSMSPTSGAVVSLLINTGGGHAIADQVDFTNFMDDGEVPWACHLTHQKTGIQGRSIMLKNPTNNSELINDDADQWCLAGPSVDNQYANTDRHFGSPGSAGKCGEFACDGVDDDCTGVADEIDGTFIQDPDEDGVCSQRDESGAWVGVDCRPLVSTCGKGLSCTIDNDGDGIPNCMDGCKDNDGDEYGTTNAAVTQHCIDHEGCADHCQDEELCDDSIAEFPRATEFHPFDASNAKDADDVAFRCTDGLDDDCDGAYDCLDDDCTPLDACRGETCDAQAAPIACGDIVTVVPGSDDFPVCTSGASGKDLVYRFRPAETGDVTFRIANLGTKRYELQWYAGTCEQNDCAAGQAEESQCAGGSITIPDADASTDYFIVAKQIGACSNGAGTAARLTVECGEICNGNGVDDDADGLIDCADPDCVQRADGGPPAADCLGDGTDLDSDFDQDGVPNWKEYACIVASDNPAMPLAHLLLPLESPLDDNFLDSDNDGALNCEDDDDDNDGALDVQEAAQCRNLFSKNDKTEHPKSTNPACAAANSFPACIKKAPLKCSVPGLDADCNKKFDTTEAECGTKEAACGDLIDEDSDNLTDCADDDCIPDPLCIDVDWDGDNASNRIELLCNTDPTDVTDVPTLAQSQDFDGDGLPNCSDGDDDNDGATDLEEKVCGSNPLDASSLPLDTDGDTQCDATDDDDDNDDFPDTQEVRCGSNPRDASSTPLDAANNLDGDLLCDNDDEDDDNDNWLDFEEVDCETDPRDATNNPTTLGQDNDNDHICDKFDQDDDDDTWPDSVEVACGTDPRSANDVPPDCEGDRICDKLDTDDDGDGVPDEIEALCGTGTCDATEFPREIDWLDTDGDKRENCIDDDDDDDGVPDVLERAGCPAPVPFPAGAANCTDQYVKDSDGDGLDDGVEDADHDGKTGPEETSPMRSDSDGDGLSDRVEAESCYPTGEPNTCAPSKGWVQDTDGDGLIDGFEDADGSGSLGVDETNPLIADTDGDGFSDGEERRCAADPLNDASFPLDLNGNEECDGAEFDTDGDGVSDALELFCDTDPFDNAEAPSRRDLQDDDGDDQINCVDVDDDADGISDKDELICGTDPRSGAETPTLDDIRDYDGDTELNCADEDDDDDGIDDVDEIALGTDPQDVDTDDDGLSDGQEVVAGTNPNNPDTDGDGLADGTEFGRPAGTADTIGTTFIPDADPTTRTDPKNPDTDGDGVKDGDEDTNHNGRVDEGEGDPLDPSDGLRDTDADGLIDRDEVLKWMTDPNNPDTDGDSLDDKLEVLVHGTDPHNPDTDGGGIVDGFEVLNKTDPKDAGDDFTTAVVSGDNVFSCTGGTSGEGAMLFFTIIGGLLLALRRRSRRVGTGAARALLIVLLSASVAAGAMDGEALAQATPNGNIQQFSPGPGEARVWSVETSQIAPHLGFYAALLFYGEHDSLILKAGRHEERLVANQQIGNLQLGLGLADYLQLGFDLPFVLGMESRDTTSINPISGGGLMDMMFRISGRFIDNRLGGFGLGLTLGTTIPAGDGAKFAGDPGVGIIVNAIADFRTGGTVLSLNVGTKIRTEEVEFLTTTFGNELSYAIGVDVEVAESVLSLGTELFGRTDLDKPFDSVDTSSLELLFGPKWQFIPNFSLQAAAGAGLVQGKGTPDFRFFFGLQYAMGDDDLDRDGIKDADDDCPHKPEDIDGFADFDGCPEYDNDNDGIPDDRDKCPNRPENFDGIEDEDGCPEAETFADRDWDGIPDDRDNCPEVPETVNGFEDGDGCKDVLPPDWGKPKVGTVVDQDCVHGLDDTIYFARSSDGLTEEAKKKLFQVAHKLNNNPYIKFISVNGHADEEGSELKNLQLSQQRARNVKAYLLEQVVDKDKMAARGFGEHAPRVDASTPEAMQENRRVDFTLEMGGKCAPTGGATAP